MASQKIRQVAGSAATMKDWHSAVDYLREQLPEKYWDLGEANLAIYLPPKLAELATNAERNAWLSTIPEPFKSTVQHFTRHVWHLNKISKKGILQSSLF